jgi:putative ABC transport system permease protein
MLKNYLIVTLRSLLRNKTFGIINISGLVLGISTCLLIAVYVIDELSFDQFHTKADRIFRLTEILHLPKESRAQVLTSPPMAPALQKNFPEVENTVRLSRSSRLLSYKDKKFFDTRIWYSDSTLLDIFSFPLIKGNPKKALVEPYSIVVTETAAKRYFGDEDPLGKSMALSDTLALTVTGVLKDLPANSHLQFDVLLSRSTMSDMLNNQPETNWFNNGTFTYVLLNENADHHILESKFSAFLHKEMAEVKKQTGLWYDLVLQPVTSIHLHSTVPSGMAPDGNIKYVYTFSLIGILVLLIACANYINLSTARSMNRVKELGMRKVIGAKRKQLIFQLLSESFLIAFIAFLISIAVVSAALPSLNSLAQKNISLLYLMKPEVVATMIFFLIAIGVLAGAYPALLMSSLSPIRVMKQYARHGRESNTLRKSLVVFQFAMSVILIAGTVIIFRQLDYMQQVKLGLDKDQIVQVQMRSSLVPKYSVIKEQLSGVSGIVSASANNFSFAGGISSIAALPEGANENEITSEMVICVDHEFIPTFSIQLVAGRNFSLDYPSDEAEAFIINETAVKHFNWGTPEMALGKKIDWGLGKNGKVIGVVKDFNYQSLRENIKPLIIHIQPDWFENITLKIQRANIQETLAGIETKWKQINEEIPFEYSFVDKDFEQMYKAEQQTRTIVTWLASLAILIACMGLFGLATFTGEQRAKEIGVRKVLGADFINVISLLSKDFLKPVFISIVIAVPITYYAAEKWLNSFAYKSSISWWVFAAAGGAALLIALMTISFQSIKSALTNPVRSLRSE